MRFMSFLTMTLSMIMLGFRRRTQLLQMLTRLRFPMNRYVFVHRFIAATNCPTTSFGLACTASFDDVSSIFPNRRDLFPLPHLVSLQDCDAIAPGDLDANALLAYVSASIDALNHWYGYKLRTIAPGYFNSVQQCCMQQWVLKDGSLLVALGQMLPEDLVARPPCLTTLMLQRLMFWIAEVI